MKEILAGFTERDAKSPTTGRVTRKPLACAGYWSGSIVFSDAGLQHQVLQLPVSDHIPLHCFNWLRTLCRQLHSGRDYLPSGLPFVEQGEGLSWSTQRWWLRGSFIDAASYNISKTYNTIQSHRKGQKRKHRFYSGDWRDRKTYGMALHALNDQRIDGSGR